MNLVQRILVTNTIRKANPYPDDIDDCVNLLIERKVLSLEKLEPISEELSEVCRQALNAARDEQPPTPPRSAISPPSSADPVPDNLHDDVALLAAARDSRDKVCNIVAERFPTKLTPGILGSQSRPLGN